MTRRVRNEQLCTRGLRFAVPCGSSLVSRCDAQDVARALRTGAKASRVDLETQVELFLEGDLVMPDTDWRAYLQMRRVTYSGEMVLKGLTSLFQSTGSFDVVADHGRWASAAALRTYGTTALHELSLHE